MNQETITGLTVQEQAPSDVPPIVESDKATSLAIIINPENMERVQAMAKMMASSKVTVPKHLQNNEGDCLAIIIQSMNWGMNPFAVAQKTHLVNGTLGYEAQLVNAVVQASNAIHGSFHYEFRGENAGLECRVGAVLRGQSEITWGEWLREGSVTTKNSPVWKSNPRQQLAYLQVKNWARLYCPGAILGVYTPEELATIPPKEINPRPRTGTEAGQASQKSAVVIDPAQEEYRSALIKQLEDIAATKGTEEFNKEWRRIGTANRNDIYLVGEPEYQRLLERATQCDADLAAAAQ